MAFMMPVMKNNYDIYKDTRGRSRKTSECSNASSSNNGTTTLATALGTPAGGAGQSSSSSHQQRRRKVSECKSESFAVSPSHGQLGGGHRMQMQRCHSSRGFTRNASRSSHNGSMLQMQMVSPTRSSPPSRTQTASALERQAAAHVAAQSAAAQQQQQQRSEQSSNDYTKFHLRLVDKLRKSFRKDSGKRS
ncbi:uncharacterized protein LOC6565918 [Drosophila grimshawi]|uniref:GH24056 n=1 Tax=Drosophila grimshawi TaxID=7222 RepID=B4JNZ4_DROGR|nr:uncharacterized protein LOC6565918 [Drosophila grimshawi]EDV92437.1 GH24056 [Drosophila grimshawi]